MNKSSPGSQKVLVVEDEPVISQICRIVLTGEGFEVDVAVNGDVAQEMLTKKDYDIVLIDVRTPVMNGKELYQYICEKHPELTRRVIFTTGDVTAGKTQQFLGESGRPFLPKPFTPGELRTVFREAVEEIEGDSAKRDHTDC
ncbi:response regulator [Chloroflexota bacterium]